MHHFHPHYDAPDPRDFIDTCATCEGTGWKDIKNPIAATIHCHCEVGQQKRRDYQARADADWQAAEDAGLWDHPELWPW